MPVVSERLRALLSGVTLAIGLTLGKTGLSPDVFTWAGFAAVVASAAVLGAGYPQAAGVMLAGALLLDSLDGAVARATGQVTRFGAFLDSTLDRWSEVAIFVGMAVLLRESWFDQIVILWAACASLLVSYTRARAESIGAECKEGLFTRFERMAVVILGLLSLQITIANAAIAVLASLTAVQRVVHVWRQIRAQ